MVAADWNEQGGMVALDALMYRIRLEASKLCHDEAQAAAHKDLPAVCAWRAAAYLKDVVCANAPTLMKAAVYIVGGPKGPLLEHGQQVDAGQAMSKVKTWIDELDVDTTRAGKVKLLSLNAVVHTILYAASEQTWISQMGVALALSTRATGGQRKMSLAVESKYTAMGYPSYSWLHTYVDQVAKNVPRNLSYVMHNPASAGKDKVIWADNFQMQGKRTSKLGHNDKYHVPVVTIGAVLAAVQHPDAQGDTLLQKRADLKPFSTHWGAPPVGNFMDLWNHTDNAQLLATYNSYCEELASFALAGAALKLPPELSEEECKAVAAEVVSSARAAAPDMAQTSMETLPPVFANPGSFEGTKSAAKKYMEAAGVQSYCDSDKTQCEWITFCADGSIAMLMHRLACEDETFKSRALIMMGHGHTLFLAMSTFMKFAGPLIGKPLEAVVHLSSLAARAMVEQNTDKHKTWQFIEWLITAVMEHQARAYRQHLATMGRAAAGDDAAAAATAATTALTGPSPPAGDFLAWMQGRAEKDKAFKVFYETVIMGGMALRLMRRSQRRNDFQGHRAAVLAFFPLWLAGGASTYVPLLAWNEETFRRAPLEVQQHIMANFAISNTGNKLSGQPIDLCGEQVGRRVKSSMHAHVDRSSYVLFSMLFVDDVYRCKESLAAGAGVQIPTSAERSRGGEHVRDFEAALMTVQLTDHARALVSTERNDRAWAEACQGIKLMKGCESLPQEDPAVWETAMTRGDTYFNEQYGMTTHGAHKGTKRVFVTRESAQAVEERKQKRQNRRRRGAASDETEVSSSDSESDDDGTLQAEVEVQADADEQYVPALAV